jgi:hypothetical protein
MTAAAEEKSVSPATPFSGEKLFLLATGALTVSQLPSWVHWLRTTYPALQLQIAVTRSATRFVSCDALSVIGKAEVFVDEWDAVGARSSRHLEIAAWADTICVFPATAHFLARFALGLADTPSLHALLATRAPIGISPALGPGVAEHPIVAAHLAALASLPNVVVAPLRPAPSAHSGRMDARGSGSLPELLGLAEERRARLSLQPGS